jgi:alpha-D-ribose 1-methylphosphonate 5-triphosphate synthase subunit PhnH
MFQSGDATRVEPRFFDPVLESQAAFRNCHSLLAAPGTLVNLGAGLQTLPGLHAAASALLLALLDSDTRLWLSPGVAVGEAAASLKFHTGCSMAAFPREADFALVACAEELPPLDAIGACWQAYPERSATVVLQVPALLDSGWRLTGPGIRDEARLSVPALGREFPSQWERNRGRFPCGIDLYLACGEHLCVLPRTTRIES